MAVSRWQAISPTGFKTKTCVGLLIVAAGCEAVFAVVYCLMVRHCCGFQACNGKSTTAVAGAETFTAPGAVC